MPVTQYEGLQQTEKELALLNRLYSCELQLRGPARAGRKSTANQQHFLLRRLYVNVITTIRGFGDLLWVDVVAQINGMTEQVIAFQTQANKLPKVC